MSKYNCTIKLPVIATRWEKHGDHEKVTAVPNHITINGVSDTSVLGAIERSPGQIDVFAPPIWIIDSGGHTFLVDDAYFEEYYNKGEEIVG